MDFNIDIDKNYVGIITWHFFASLYNVMDIDCRQNFIQAQSFKKI